MSPDPYVKIYRKLDVVPSAQDDPDMPSRCPVYSSTYVKHTREAAWKTSPIPLQLMCNGSDAAQLVLEVWDFQYNAEDRLIGTVELTAGQLLNTGTKGPQSPRQQKYAATHKLKPPSFLEATTSSVDRMASFMTGGVSASPGEVSILNAEVYDTPELADTHADCFDIDTILREKKASQPLTWEPLRERRGKVTAKIRSGILVHDTSCTKRLAKWRRSTANRMAHLGVQKCVLKYAPFYRSRMYVGARFGSAFEAFFSFSYMLIRMNLVLAIVWFLPVVLPQLLLMDPAPAFISDVAEALGFVDYITRFNELRNRFNTQFSEGEDEASQQASVNALTSYFQSGNTTTFEPGVLVFDGYLPKFPMTKLLSSYGISAGTLDSQYYNLGFCYVCCTVVMVCASLFSVVCALGSQIAHVTETASAARSDGTGQIIEAMFGGWDHVETSGEGTKKTRYAMVTQMKEGLGEAVRNAERSAKVKTQKQKQNLLLVRIGVGTLSVAFVVASVLVVLSVSAPAGLLPGHIDVRSWLMEADRNISVPFVTPLHSLIFILTNMLSPVIIKQLVKLEQVCSTRGRQSRGHTPHPS